MKDYQRIYLWGVTIGNGIVYQSIPVNAARSLNEAAAYLSALNDARVGERNDWRLPNIKELARLLERGRINPAVNTDYFTSVPLGKFMSSTPAGDGCWTIDTMSGMTSTAPATEKLFVWAVSGVEQPIHDWKMLDEGTVTDGSTGLVWRRSHEMPTDPKQPDDWETRVNRVRWEDVPALCTNGWRLPTAEEMIGIVDERFSNPAIDVNVFTPPPFQSLFWTSDPAQDAQHNSDLVWCVNFGIGVSLPTTTHGKAYVRLVRDSGAVPMPVPTPSPTPAPVPPAPTPQPTPAPTLPPVPPGTVTFTTQELASILAQLDAARTALILKF